jgi:hypothetical protein
MEDFLEEKCRVMEQVGLNSRPQYTSMPGFFKVNTSQSNQSKAGGSTVHLTYQCSNLTETKDIGERIKKVKSKNLCFNCLKSTHQVGNCDSTFSCRYCRKRHHSLLHDPATVD